MPIKGLTDRNARFPRLGIISKGEPKTGNRPGKDLDYFRLRGTGKNPIDPEIDRQFKKVYGERPKKINVFLPSDNVEGCFESWMEEWSATRLAKRCDGENILIIDGKPREHCSFNLVPCVPESCKCKPIGRLQVFIPEIKRLGYFEVQTHSKHDIIRITEQLLAVEQAIGTLKGIPFWLKRVPEEISCPMGNDKRSRQTKWLLQIEAQPIEIQQQRLFGSIPVSSPAIASSKTIEVYPSDSPSPVETSIETFWGTVKKLGYRESDVRNWLNKNYKNSDPSQMTEEALLNAIATLQNELI